jgi:D-alanine--D-alanine ligase
MLKKDSMKNKLKIAVVCGGPSLERGISINSARSVMDHLGGTNIDIVPIYFDHLKNAYQISTTQLYSNTPSDFDFKLQTNATALNESELIKVLKSVDLVFPAMHGEFGEDGGIQSILEKNNIPFVGSPSLGCTLAFDKFKANEYIKSNGFFVLPSIAIDDNDKDKEKKINQFFKDNKIKRAIVKPATGGSSIGVYSVNGPKEALETAKKLFDKKVDKRVVIEQFAKGVEFTVIILQNRFGMPVSLLPTEIELDYTKHQIFDYRKKYLPTNKVRWHYPPRFSDDTIYKIKTQSEQLFALLGMRDFARFDGWILPNGKIWFSDFNPISGMEQNSFLFQQSAFVGFTHKDILHYIVRNACNRYNISYPEIKEKVVNKKKDVAVLFGGQTSERQVSLMSGTNVWHKLRKSEVYNPEPYIFDMEKNIWHLPYAYTLNHTVEEIIDNCNNALKINQKLKELCTKIIIRLGLEKGDISLTHTLPKKISFNEFVKKSKFVFLALHGGEGEDGTLQKIFEDNHVKYNGSSSKISEICMDKYETGEHLLGLENQGIYVAPRKIFSITEIKNTKKLWIELVKELGSINLIVKPIGDGCSSGIVRIHNELEFAKYLQIAKRRDFAIPPNTFINQSGIIEMPNVKMDKILLEKCIETDVIGVNGTKLVHKHKSGYVEMTVGVLEDKGKIKSLSPSITVAESAILSVEEKFQGGTGVNITPPPQEIISEKNLKRVKTLVEKVAEKIGIRGYARIDIFVEIKTGNIIVIEVNNLPGLTPSTVIYHQALAENPPMYPTQFLEKLIKNKGY